jgi:predicted DNA-binding transcriptional regulator YafY
LTKIGKAQKVDKFLRWLRIIYILQANPGISSRDLSNRCDVSERTLFRDIQDMATIVPIYSEGHSKGHQFRGDFALYPLNWTDEEHLAFSLLPAALDTNKLLVHPQLHKAYDKVMAAQHKDKRKRQSFISHISETIQMGTPIYRKDHNDFLPQIIEAILRQTTVRTVYHTQHRDTETVRDIDPYYLVPREHRFYLIGYCHHQHAVRTFRISRFIEVELTEQTFDKTTFSLKKYLKNTWSIIRGDQHIHFKIKFSEKIARYIKEEELFVQPQISDLSDGSLLFEVKLNDDQEFLNWLSQYGPDAEILEPLEYRSMMRERLKVWQEVYAK